MHGITSARRAHQGPEAPRAARRTGSYPHLSSCHRRERLRSAPTRCKRGVRIRTQIHPPRKLLFSGLLQDQRECRPVRRDLSDARALRKDRTKGRRSLRLSLGFPRRHRSPEQKPSRPPGASLSRWPHPDLRRAPRPSRSPRQLGNDPSFMKEMSSGGRGGSASG